MRVADLITASLLMLVGGVVLTDAVRLGIGSVRRLGADLAQQIESGRPYTSLEDLVRRVPELNLAQLEAMATAGLFEQSLGLERRQALWGHVLRNAMIPVLTIMGLQFAFLISGTVVVEQVFVLPGVGRLVFQAIANRDLVVVRDVVLLLVAMVVAVNFVVDVLYAVVDPRLKTSDA